MFDIKVLITREYQVQNPELNPISLTKSMPYFIRRYMEVHENDINPDPHNFLKLHLGSLM